MPVNRQTVGRGHGIELAVNELLDAVPFAGYAQVETIYANLPAQVNRCVCIPARNEEDELPNTLLALGKSLKGCSDDTAVVFVLNDTNDRSSTIIREWAVMQAVHHVLVNVWFHHTISNAPHARRLALDIGNLIAPNGKLLTTDADTRVAVDWILENTKLLRDDGTLVCGAVDINAVALNALPRPVIECGKIEHAYRLATQELWLRLTHPKPPQLYVKAMGASLAIRSADYRSVGRLPVPPVAEDKALAAICLRSGLKVVEAANVKVVTSARINARAEGGMGDAFRDRATEPDPFCDEALVPLKTLQRRARFWNSLRQSNAIEDARKQFYKGTETMRSLTAPRMRLSEVRAELVSVWECLADARPDMHAAC